jgi:hypothetical protein
VGKEKNYSGVRLGFNYGYLIDDEINYLQKGERKQIFWRDFLSVTEIDFDLLKAYIFEAVAIDDRIGA